MWQQILTRALGALAIVILAMPAAQAATEAGVVLMSVGSVQATAADGSSRDLKRRSPVFAGDTLRTGGSGRAQVKFTDGSILALKPGSTLRLDAYAYRDAAAADTSVMSLVKGGFRTVTGAIGKLNKANYKVNTPVATIGIRGTLYETWFDEGKGLGLAAWDGGISACNDSGCLDLGMNADHRFGFVPVGGAARGMDSEPDGIGADDDNVAGTDGVLGTLESELVSNDIVPDGLLDAGAPSRAAYPKVGYALISGAGVVASDFASVTMDPLQPGLVTDWSLVDNTSGVELSAAPPYDCGGETCSSWYASSNNITGSDVVWGGWSQVNVGLAGSSLGAAENFGDFVIAEYVSPADVTAFGAALVAQAPTSPIFSAWTTGSAFAASSGNFVTGSGSISIDFGQNSVTGDLSAFDSLASNSWNLSFTGIVDNGSLVLAIDEATSNFTNGLAETLGVTGNIEASFFGAGTVEGVIGGVEASTVGANSVTGQVETLQGVFQMDPNGG